jgi:thioredoxin 1
VRSVTDETFDDEVLGAEKPVVVDFWAPWCGPCKAIAPALEELAAATDKVEFVKLDIDANPKTADRYGVLSIPTVILFDGGEPQRTVFGSRPKKHFEKSFASYF